MFWWKLFLILFSFWKYDQSPVEEFFTMDLNLLFFAFLLKNNFFCQPDLLPDADDELYKPDLHPVLVELVF